MISHTIPDNIVLKQIKRISPSIFSVFKSCPLQGIFLVSNIPKMLPSSPNSYLGSIVHKTIQKAKRGEIINKRDFELAWNGLVKEYEKKMVESTLENRFIPIREHAKDYEIKKILCEKYVRGFYRRMNKDLLLHEFKDTFLLGCRSEVWLQTANCKVGGYADEIISTVRGDIIVDYKTGNYMEPDDFENGVRLKEQYAVQLKLYSALYYLMYSKWPTGLKIAGIKGDHFNVEFYPEECIALLQEAIDIVDEINKIIEDQSTLNCNKIIKLSSPSPENCKYCQYRPGCKSYFDLLLQNVPLLEGEWPNDIYGKVEQRDILGNGRIYIKLLLENYPQKIVKIRGISSKRHPILDKIGNRVALFSLLHDSKEYSYQEGIFTTSYGIS